MRAVAPPKAWGKVLFALVRWQWNNHPPEEAAAAAQHPFRVPLSSRGAGAGPPPTRSLGGTHLSWPDLGVGVGFNEGQVFLPGSVWL